MSLKNLAFLALFVSATIAGGAQNLTTGTITSAPANTTPDRTKITFTNTSTGDKFSQRTLDGIFSQNIPSGTYQRKIEAKPGIYRCTEQ